MAKLQKGLQDYFKIPILLKPVGSTSNQSLQKIHKALSKNFTGLVIDDRYQALKTPHSKLLQKRQKNVTQSFRFRAQDILNEWSQFEVIYRCRFCIGVFNSQGNLIEQWKKALKSCADQNKKMVGLMILSISNCDVEGIKQPSIIIPEKLEQNEYMQFLQPWFYSILALMQDHICYIVSQLQKQDNSFIVFNKLEQKPEPRTLKKKKRGRCLKVCGDFCLILNMVKQAYAFYIQAEQILRKVDDYLWVMGCNQGKLACFTTDTQFKDVNKESALQATRIQCINLGKKIKITHLETENYFKILKVYTKITATFQDMARQFCAYVLSNYSTSEKFSIIVQLAMLYKEAGMIRKQNYMLFLAARIAMDLKPILGNIIMTQILKSQYIKEWPLLNANLIKLIIDNTCDSQNGLLHLNLIQNCSTVMTERDIEITLEALERRNFSDIRLQKLSAFQIVSINCKESQIKPKANNLIQQSPTKGSTTFFMNWRKKQTLYKYQKNEQITLQVKISNKLPFRIRCGVKLHFSKQSQNKFQYFELHPKLNKIYLKESFNSTYDLVTLQQIELKLFNFSYFCQGTSLPSIKMEIYQEYPKLMIEAPEVFQNQQSSLFQFPITIKRNKKYIKLQKIQLTVSIYYNIQVGYQEATFKIQNSQQLSFILVLEDFPYSEASQTKSQLLRLPPLRANKKYLKKIECRVDFIATLQSKYQISALSSTICVFERSIWCELVNITTPMQIKFNKKDQKIVEEQFIIKISVNKKEDDLTPYKIIQSNVLFSLSQKTSVIIQQTFKKFKKLKDYEENTLKMSIQWMNSTRQKECGVIEFQVPMNPIMFMSEKFVNFNIKQWNGKNRQQLPSPGNLNISYTVESDNKDCNLSHQFVIQPRNLPNIRKYITAGKTKIIYKKPNQQNSGKNMASVSNQLKIKVFYEYDQQYMIGLKFEDGETYWHPSVFYVISSSKQ